MSNLQEEGWTPLIDADVIVTPFIKLPPIPTKCDLCGQSFKKSDVFVSELNVKWRAWHRECYALRGKENA